MQDKESNFDSLGITSIWDLLTRVAEVQNNIAKKSLHALQIYFLGLHTAFSYTALYDRNEEDTS